MESARKLRTISPFFLSTHGANARPVTSASSSRVSLGSSPATSTQMVSLLLLPASIAVSRTAQIGRPSGIVFCVWSVRDLARGRAVAATRNLTSLVSILSRMMILSFLVRYVAVRLGYDHFVLCGGPLRPHDAD